MKYIAFFTLLCVVNITLAFQQPHNIAQSQTSVDLAVRPRSFSACRSTSTPNLHTAEQNSIVRELSTSTNSATPSPTEINASRTLSASGTPVALCADSDADDEVSPNCATTVPICLHAATKLLKSERKSPKMIEFSVKQIEKKEKAELKISQKTPQTPGNSEPSSPAPTIFCVEDPLKGEAKLEALVIDIQKRMGQLDQTLKQLTTAIAALRQGKGTAFTAQKS